MAGTALLRSIKQQPKVKARKDTLLSCFIRSPDCEYLRLTSLGYRPLRRMSTEPGAREHCIVRFSAVSPNETRGRRSLKAPPPSLRTASRVTSERSHA